MPLDAGSRLGAYEVLAQLGAGGMGEVYRAKDTKLGREVALKILPATFTNDPERQVPQGSAGARVTQRCTHRADLRPLQLLRHAAQAAGYP